MPRKRRWGLILAAAFVLMILIPAVWPLVSQTRYASELGSARSASHSLVAELKSIRAEASELAHAPDEDKRKSAARKLRASVDDASADAEKVQSYLQKRSIATEDVGPSSERIIQIISQVVGGNDSNRNSKN